MISFVINKSRNRYDNLASCVQQVKYNIFATDEINIYTFLYGISLKSAYCKKNGTVRDEKQKSILTVSRKRE